MASIYDFNANDLDGKPTSLAEFRGKPMLIVNTASKCGFTPQYEGLEKMYEANKDKGLVVLGFPCDQFGHQEPGNAEEIRNFCSLTYDVNFPMFEKVEVNGKGAHPLWQWLKKEKPGLLGMEAIKWNFTKFLVDRKGNVLERYAPNAEPASLEPDIKKTL